MVKCLMTRGRTHKIGRLEQAHLVSDCPPTAAQKRTFNNFGSVATLRHLMCPLPTFDGRRLSADQQPQDIASLLTIRYIHSSVYA